MLLGPRIGLACPSPDERAQLSTWLTGAGYDVVELKDPHKLDDDVLASRVQALLVDYALVARPDEVWSLARRLGINRPLLVVGEVKSVPVSARGEWSVVARPLAQDMLVLAVGLALAEGRPARRHQRRQVLPIPASAHGMAATVREASASGVGLELFGPRAKVLPPFFKLRIPRFGVHVVVKRAWVTPGGATSTRCGGTVEGDLPDASRPWSDFARQAPEPGAADRRR